MTYIHRLVGLPGEELSIKDGRVWIGGKPLTPPDPISKLTYVAFPTRGKDAVGGPWRLGADAYFVLGDFSQRAKDSRLAEPGPPRS